MKHATRRHSTILLATATGIATMALPAHAVQLRPSVAKSASTTFAGYQVDKPATHIKTAAETFTVPSITCKKNFSGVGPAVLVQSTVNKKTNTFTVSGGGVGVACQHKQPVYVAILEAKSTTLDDFTLSPGDVATVTVRMTKRKTTVKLVDATSGEHKAFSKGGSTGQTASLGASSLQIEKKGVGLDPFSKISITNATVNGKPIGSQHPTRFTWTSKPTKQGKSHPLVAAGPLKAKKKFSITFKHSQ
jgi:hypothetical protein